MTVGSERDDPRRREPQALGDVIRGVLGSGRMRAGMALGRLARSWDQVVGGGRLAEATAPVGLERGGLRVSATSSAWAAQVTFLSDDIRRRANEILGSDEVSSVHVVVDGSGARTH